MYKKHESSFLHEVLSRNIKKSRCAFFDARHLHNTVTRSITLKTSIFRYSFWYSWSACMITACESFLHEVLTRNIKKSRCAFFWKFNVTCTLLQIEILRWNVRSCWKYCWFSSFSSLPASLQATGLLTSPSLRWIPTKPNVWIHSSDLRSAGTNVWVDFLKILFFRFFSSTL